MPDVAAFLMRTHGRTRFDWTDWVSYAYLFVGLFLMFGPVLWIVMSSFKTQAALSEFPPTFLPAGQKTVEIKGQEGRSPLFVVKMPDGSTRELAEIRRMGLNATMVDPAKPEEEIQVNINDRTKTREIRIATENYTQLFGRFSFGRYLWNSVFITVVATLITLLF